MSRKLFIQISVLLCFAGVIVYCCMPKYYFKVFKDFRLITVCNEVTGAITFWRYDTEKGIWKKFRKKKVKKQRLKEPEESEILKSIRLGRDEVETLMRESLEKFEKSKK